MAVASNTESVSSTACGTRNYRVVVSGMLTTLQTAVTTDACYTVPQTALFTCMNRDSSGGAR